MAFNSGQIGVARELYGVARERNAGPKALKALLETGIVESGLSNPQGGDRDSIGTLQQRPSQGWGSPQQLRSIRYQAEQFLKRAIPIAGKYGSSGQLAQAVQRSAFPERYDKHGGEAQQLLQMLSGGRGSGAPLAGGGGGGGANAAQLADMQLLTKLSSTLQQPPAEVGAVPAPSFAAGPTLPQGYVAPAPLAQQPSPARPDALMSLVAKIGQDSTAQGSQLAAAPGAGSVPNSKGGIGFTPAGGTNYTHGQLPAIATRLNKLADALHLKLQGVSGYRSPQHSVAVGGFADDPHTRGEASDTPGVEDVPEAVLNRYGLERPFDKIVNGKHTNPKEADHIQLRGSQR